MPRVHHTAEQLRELRVFGWIPGGRLILDRQWDGDDACRRCNGFGTYGMPLCGAVRTCEECQGSGQRVTLKATLQLAWELSVIGRLWRRLQR